MTIRDLINDGLLINTVSDSSDELFNEVSELLKEKDLVKNDYLEAIKKREAEFPTGLQTNSYAIALPHVEAKYVKTNALIICRSKDGIPFKRMDDNSSTISAKIIFILLINDSSIHVKTLAELIKLWRDKELLDLIYKADDKREILDYMENLQWKN